MKDKQLAISMRLTSLKYFLSSNWLLQAPAEMETHCLMVKLFLKQ